MPDPIITRLVSTHGTTRELEFDDGSIAERSGGTVSWRNNNPGNLKFEHTGSADQTVTNPRTRDQALAAAQGRYQGVVDLDQWGNAIFESYEAGRAAKIQLLERSHSEHTVEQLLPSYSRNDYSGSTNHSAQAAAIFAEGDRQGVDLRSKTVGAMSTQEREALADGIRRFEGWREGEVTVTRQPTVTPTLQQQPGQARSTTSPQSQTIPQAENSAADTRSFDAVMRTMLPPQSGVAPHITSDFGPRSVTGGSSDHRGVDFNYRGGQAGANLQHPTVRSPVSGEVVFSGGQFGTVKIRDSEGNMHEVLHMNSRTVQLTDPPTHVNAGDPIGTMGGRGPNGASQYAQHVHYQVRDPSGQTVDPERFWNNRQVQTPAQSGTEARSQAATPADGNLRLNDRGPQVIALQESLNRLGYTGRDGQPLESRSGIYGPETRSAVEAMQRAHGIGVDGVVGRDTKGALASSAERPLLSEATHPGHPLFAEIARQLPPGTRPEVAANITLQAMENGITRERLSGVLVRDGDVFVGGGMAGERVRVDLTAPTPTMQQMSDHTRQPAQQPAQQDPVRTQDPLQNSDPETLRPRTMMA